MMKRKICQFNGRSKYWNYYFRRGVKPFSNFKRFREYKGEEVKSVTHVDLTSSWSCCFFPLKPFRCRFEKVQELIDESNC
jgi:hypothetical protein